MLTNKASLLQQSKVTSVVLDAHVRKLYKNMSTELPVFLSLSLSVFFAVSSCCYAEIACFIVHEHSMSTIVSAVWKLFDVLGDF